jgi:hypothetical protein
VRPSLFEVDGFEPSSAAAPAVQTPLGVVELRCAIGGDNLTTLASETVAGTTGDGQLMLWDSPDLWAELLMRPFGGPPVEPDSGCILATWRLLAHRPTPPVALSIGWSPGASWVYHSPDSGECFDALTYQDAEIEGETVDVSFGTVSGDCVTAGAAGWWPDRWTWEILGCDHPYCEGLVEYEPGRLTVPLPAFVENERCTVRFSVAWGSPTAELPPRSRADDALWSTFLPKNV